MEGEEPEKTDDTGKLIHRKKAHERLMNRQEPACCFSLGSFFFRVKRSRSPSIFSGARGVLSVRRRIKAVPCFGVVAGRVRRGRQPLSGPFAWGSEGGGAEDEGGRIGMEHILIGSEKVTRG